MLFGYCKYCKHQNTTPGSDAFQREDYQQAPKQHVFTKKTMTNHDMPVNLWQESLLRRIKLVPLHLLLGRTTTSRAMRFVSESTLVPLSSVWLRREGVGRNRLGALFGTPEQQHGAYKVLSMMCLSRLYLYLLLSKSLCTPYVLPPTSDGLWSSTTVPTAQTWNMDCTGKAIPPDWKLEWPTCHQKKSIES